MRLLADENIPLDTVRALRSAGHDVFSATESAPGAADTSLLERATTERRLLITFDRDFGELAARRGQQATSGILLLRIIPASADDVTRMVIDLLVRADVTWDRRITVVDAAQLRQRPL